jgi:hypothetical protein
LDQTLVVVLGRSFVIPGQQMLKWRQAAVIALFACLVVGFGWLDRTSSLQSPNQSAIEKAGNQAHKHASVIALPKSPDERIADYTWWVAAFTFSLTLVSAFQIFFLIRADKTARETADAAKRNADALISSERAHLYVVIESSNLQDSIGPVAYLDFSKTFGQKLADDAFVSTRPAVHFSLKNLGKTAAIVTEVGYQLIQGAEKQGIWEHIAPSANLLRPVIDGNAQSEPVECGLRNTFRVRDGKAAMDGTRPLYFYGHTSFVDSFSRRYTYFWRYQNVGITFVMVHSEERTDQT